MQVRWCCNGRAGRISKYNLTIYVYYSFDFLFRVLYNMSKVASLKALFKTMRIIDAVELSYSSVQRGWDVNGGMYMICLHLVKSLLFVWCVVGIPIAERNVTQWVKLCQERLSPPPVNISSLAPLIIRGTSEGSKGVSSVSAAAPSSTKHHTHTQPQPQSSVQTSLVSSLQLAGTGIGTVSDTGTGGHAGTVTAEAAGEAGDASVTTIRRSNSLNRLN